MKVSTKEVLLNVHNKFYSPCLTVGDVLIEFLLKAEGLTADEKLKNFELARVITHGGIIEIDEVAMQFIEKMSNGLPIEIFGSFKEAFKKATIE